MKHISLLIMYFVFAGVATSAATKDPPDNRSDALTKQLVGAWKVDVEAMKRDAIAGPAVRTAEGGFALKYLEPLVYHYRPDGTLAVPGVADSVRYEIKRVGESVLDVRIHHEVLQAHPQRFAIIDADHLRVEPGMKIDGQTVPLFFQRIFDPDNQVVGGWTVDPLSLAKADWFAHLDEGTQTKRLAEAKGIQLTVFSNGRARIALPDEVRSGRLHLAAESGYEFIPDRAHAPLITLKDSDGKQALLHWQERIWPVNRDPFDARSVLIGKWEFDVDRFLTMEWVRKLPEAKRHEHIAKQAEVDPELSSLFDDKDVEVEHVSGRQYAVKVFGELSHYIVIDDRTHLRMLAGYGREYPYKRVP